MPFEQKAPGRKAHREWRIPAGAEQRRAEVLSARTLRAVALSAAGGIGLRSRQDFQTTARLEGQWHYTLGSNQKKTWIG